MTVATMTEFEALTIPATISVADTNNTRVRWDLTEAGWVREDYPNAPVPSRFFAGFVTSGLVAIGGTRQLAVGDLYQRDGRDYYIALSPMQDDDHGWWFLALSERGEAAGLMTYRRRSFEGEPSMRLVPADERPAWYPVGSGLALWTLARHLASTREVEDLQQRLARLTQERAQERAASMVETVPPALALALKAYAEEAEDEDFDAILNRHGIGRSVPCDVTVVLRGSTPWTRTVTLTRSGVGCVCDQVDRDDLQEFLPDDPGEWTYTATCDDD